MKDRKVHQILSVAFERKEKQARGYSRRALARDLGVSPAFVTHMLKGKKKPPQERLSSLIKILELDTIEQRELSRAFLIEKSDSPALVALLKKELRPDTLQRKTILNTKQEDLLAEWWFIPVMESLSLVDRGEDAYQRLGITKAQWSHAIKALLREGLIEKTKDGFKKTENHLYLSTGRSKANVRSFHTQMIGKAISAMDKTSESDFERRLITGYTFALSESQTNELKTMIMRFLDRAARKATEGECTDVYQLNVQLFPLTKKSPNIFSD